MITKKFLFVAMIVTLLEAKACDAWLTSFEKSLSEDEPARQIQRLGDIEHPDLILAELREFFDFKTTPINSYDDNVIMAVTLPALKGKRIAYLNRALDTTLQSMPSITADDQEHSIKAMRAYIIALVRAGADPNTQTFYWNNHALLDFVRTEDFDYAQALIDHGADVHLPMGIEKLPLVCYARSAQAAEFLIEQGAILPTFPLHRVALDEYARPSLLKLYIEKHQVDVNGKNDNGDRPLDLLLNNFNYSHHQKMLQRKAAVLLDYGAQYEHIRNELRRELGEQKKGKKKDELDRAIRRHDQFIYDMLAEYKKNR